MVAQQSVVPSSELAEISFETSTGSCKDREKKREHRNKEMSSERRNKKGLLGEVKEEEK